MIISVEIANCSPCYETVSVDTQITENPSSGVDISHTMEKYTMLNVQVVPQVVSIVRFYCTSTGVRFYCTSTGPIGGLNCEVLLYFNWSHRWSQL